MSEQDQQYNETSFWRKIRRFALRAGRGVIEKALILYFCMRDPATPRWARGVIIGALVYFVLPLDAVPDFLPGIGFTDDLGVLATALTTILAHVKPEHQQRAHELLEWKWATDRTGNRGTNRGGRAHGADQQARSEVDAATRYAAILGVKPNGDVQTIRAHYLDRVKKYHPDRVQHLGPEFQEMAEQKMKDINAAYSFFKNKFPGL